MRCEVCSKLPIKTLEYVKLTIKVNNKDTVGVVLVSLFLILKFIQVGLYLEESKYAEGIVFGMLTGLHVWRGRGIYSEGLYTERALRGFYGMICLTLVKK